MRVSEPVKDNEPMRSKRVFAALAFTVAAFGQSRPAPSPNVPYGVSISAEAAKKVAAAAIAEAHKNNWAMAVAIVDTAGYLVYFERMQDTQLGSVDIAIEKAKSAALFRRPTKSFQDTVAAGGEGLRILRLTGAVPVEGGIPLIVEGKIIGAVGASGGSSDQDGRTAQAGAAAMK
jgi:glc operon protein GlcG